MTAKVWVVEPVNEPRQFIHADQMWNVADGNLIFTLAGVLVRAFARDSYFDVSIANDVTAAPTGPEPRTDAAVGR